MRILSIAACIAALAFWPSWCRAEIPCTATANETVDVTGRSFRLADLLTPESCPAVLRVAAGMRLGQVPLPGSVRVFAGAEVRGLIEKAATLAHASADIEVPQRVRVLRADARASCAGIDARILSIPISAGVECGAAGRIPRAARLLLNKTAWDASTGRWNVVARCAHAEDCVPFLIQVPGSGAEFQSESASASAGDSSAPTTRPRNVASHLRPASASEKPLVQPGQHATLVWDQDGIRVAGTVTCLDRGGMGDAVRARMGPGGRVIRATVVRAGLLRAQT